MYILVSIYGWRSAVTDLIYRQRLQTKLSQDIISFAVALLTTRLVTVRQVQRYIMHNCITNIRSHFSFYLLLEVICY